MCYQRFMTYVCGCGTLEIDAPCELATHPFNIRLNCPNYLSESHHVSPACGTHGFFCARSKDAKYIYRLFQLRDDAQLKCQLLSAFQKACKEHLDRLRNLALTNGASLERLSTDSEYNETNIKWRTSIEQCNALAAKGKMVEHSVQEVKAFYFRYRGPHTPNQGFSKAPSFLDVIGARIPASISTSLVNVSRTGSGTQVPEGDNIIVKRREAVPPAQEEVKCEEPLPQSSGYLARIKQQPPPKRRARKSLSPEKSEVEEEPQAPRRSTRVSKKNVNYEESDGSSPARAVSPGESEVSGFTPSNRSDVSPSPDRSPPKRKRSKPTFQSRSSSLDRKPGRTANFGRMMSEYRERLSRASSPAGSNVRRDSTIILPDNKAEKDGNPRLGLPQSYQQRQIPQPFPQVANSTPSYSRPPTRHGPPNQQQLNSAVNNFAYPAAKPNFLPARQVSQLAAQHIFTPMSAAQRQQYRNSLPEVEHLLTTTSQHSQQAAVRQLFHSTPQRDSSYPERLVASTYIPRAVKNEHIESQSPQNNFGLVPMQADGGPINTPYDQMKRSFNALAELTPPSASNAALPTTDPKKRKQPVSSPLLPNAKRPRLSFPGDELTGSPGRITTILGQQAPPRSSPSKIPSHIVADSRYNAASGEQTEQLATPAPNFAPTAVMYQPSLQQESIGDLAIHNNIQNIQGGDVVQDFDDGFFDELIEEDKLSTDLPDFIFG